MRVERKDSYANIHYRNDGAKARRDPHNNTIIKISSTIAHLPAGRTKVFWVKEDITIGTVF